MLGAAHGEALLRNQRTENYNLSQGRTATKTVEGHPHQEQVAAEAVVAASTPRIYGSLNPKMMSSNSNLRICATAGLTFAGHDPSLFRRQDPARIGEAPMIDADSVRRATMLLQRAQQLTAAAHRAANRSYLLSLAETYRTAADELAPGTPDPATELFSTSGVKPTQ